MKTMLLLIATVTFSAQSFAAVADATVDISQFAFSPATIVVPAGTKVIWTNQDKVNHSVIGDAAKCKFSSAPLKQGDTFSYTFATPGTYSYHCGYHNYMTATITVK